MWCHPLIFVVGLLCSAYLYLPSSCIAQSEAEHLSHHPELAAQATAGVSSSQPAPIAQAAPPGAPPGAPAGMMQGMGEMMKKMGLPPKKDFYPSLVEVPNLSSERWSEIQQTAHARMSDGLDQLSQGLGSLAAAVDSDNFAQMQQSLTDMQQGIRLVESGLSAHRLLAEGESPRNIALNWFKTEMNLREPVALLPHSFFGLSLFHIMVMVLLSLFSATMILMYFFKMRRAEALFGRIDPDKDPPPSGGSPPNAGTSSSAAPLALASPSGGASATKEQGRGTELAVSPLKPPTPPVARDSPSATTANWRGKLRVGSIFSETPNVKTFRLLPPSDEHFLPFTFVPGQFLNLTFWIGGAKMNRSYSISSSPLQREYVDLTIRREPRGAVSRHTNDLLKIGELIEAGGPIGKFTFDGTDAESIVLISAGVGITPMMSIARYLTERSWTGDIFFIFTCRTPADFIFAKDITQLQRQNQKLHVAVTITKAEGTDWKGARGRMSKEWLSQAVPDLALRRIHVCGPQSMMDATKAILTELGVAPDNIKTESFGVTRPAPAAAGTTAKPASLATGPMVTFSKNGKSAKIRLDLKSGDSPPEQTILELSEELGIGIEFACRVGTCGLCKVKMTSGEVDMAVQDSLEPDDKTNGLILACQAKPKGDVTVEA